MDASFKKHERLCKKKEFDALFSSSKVLSSQNIKVVFAFLNTPDKPVVKVAFSVSSKHFKKAVKRNYLKRIMREHYRKNKYLLYSVLKEKSIYLLFIYNSKDIIGYWEMEPQILLLLQKIKEHYLQSQTDENN
jgi:ribonuclease P protein component